MARYFRETVRDHRPCIAEHMAHVWTFERPARISVAGRTLQAEGDLIVFGLSVVTGGPLEFARRIANARSAFHAQRARLTSKYLSFETRRERWLRHVSPVLAFGSGGWLWNAATKNTGGDRQSHDPRCHGPSPTR